MDSWEALDLRSIEGVWAGCFPHSQGCSPPRSLPARCSRSPLTVLRFLPQCGAAVAKIIPFRKPRRLTPEIVGELLRVHSSCVHDQAGKCPLLVSVSSLTWELNQAANIGNEEDNAFRRTGADGLCAARPLSDHDIERIVEGRRLADSMMEEPE